MSRPALRALAGVISVVFLSACPLRNREQPPLILRGSYNCLTGAVQISAAGRQRQSFPSLDAAALALRKEEYTEEGVEGLKEVLLSVCGGDEWRPFKTARRTHVPTFSDAARGRPRSGATRTAQSTLIKFKKKGQVVEFRLSAVPVPPGHESELGRYIEAAEDKKGCQLVTPSPPCFKCPDGTGFCITQKIKK